jgi:hypothetical protein
MFHAHSKLGLFIEGGKTEMKQEEEEENYIRSFVTVPLFTKKARHVTYM